MYEKLKKELYKLRNSEKAKNLTRFFKTGKGEYGEGDVFLGVTVPLQRKTAKKFYNISLYELERLLNDRIHEYRLCALIILVEKFKKAHESEKDIIVEFYLRNTKNINNWDLVDMTAPYILGEYLLDKDKMILYRLSFSKDLWERRISIMSTFTFIRNNRFEDTLKIAEILLEDEHDLIHKAVGWMLRELGKREQNLEEKFLKKHIKNMPRTMLRYAIEKFEDRRRKTYLNMKREVL
ncbi:DNA alkylation repair protein [Elusimicrobiota bacterium]